MIPKVDIDAFSLKAMIPNRFSIKMWSRIIRDHTLALAADCAAGTIPPAGALPKIRKGNPQLQHSEGTRRAVLHHVPSVLFKVKQAHEQNDGCFQESFITCVNGPFYTSLCY